LTPPRRAGECNQPLNLFSEARMLKLSEIIQDLHALELRVRDYEFKYGITSADFLKLYEQGLLDDDGFEQSTEFVRWASTCQLKVKREAAFKAASHNFLNTLKVSMGQPIQLTPNPALV